MTVEEAKSFPRRISLFGPVLIVIGVLFATASLASVSQRWGDITMSTITGEALAKYRQFAYVAKSILFDSWISYFWPSVKLPIWAFDLFSLWAIAIGGILRDLGAQHWQFEHTRVFISKFPKNGTEKYRIWRWFRDDYLVWSLLCPPYMVIKFFRRKWQSVYGYFRWHIKSKSLRQGLSWGAEFRSELVGFILALTPLFGVVGFFVWNAAML